MNNKTMEVLDKLLGTKRIFKKVLDENKEIIEFELKDGSRISYNETIKQIINNNQIFKILESNSELKIELRVKNNSTGDDITTLPIVKK